MLIKNIEKKIKLGLWLSIGSFVTAVVLVALGFSLCYRLVEESKKKIYVLDRGVPILLERTDLNVNRKVEYKAHVELFHSLFFSFPPDNEYIQSQLEKAMQLADNSAAKQYNSLRESGYYNSVLAASAMVSIKADSIVLDGNDHHFLYYGKQRIERPTSVLIRSIVTEGYLSDVKRSENNPHGVMITRWRTLENKDLDYVEKRDF